MNGMKERVTFSQSKKPPHTLTQTSRHQTGKTRFLLQEGGTAAQRRRSVFCSAFALSRYGQGGRVCSRGSGGGVDSGAMKGWLAQEQGTPRLRGEITGGAKEGC